ncbi:hypothetical protein, partial [Mesorhizobium marinum]|uniref:hypothetical protein n=1 Tax=Mesorhizobium marinum TaxID=3228790 RepID=UPI00346539A7
MNECSLSKGLPRSRSLFPADCGGLGAADAKRPSRALISLSNQAMEIASETRRFRSMTIARKLVSASALAGLSVILAGCLGGGGGG